MQRRRESDRLDLLTAGGSCRFDVACGCDGDERGGFGVEGIRGYRFDWCAAAEQYVGAEHHRAVAGWAAAERGDGCMVGHAADLLRLPVAAVQRGGCGMQRH